jgi:hypothetical protein
LAAALPPGGCIILRQVFLTDRTAAAQWLVNIPFKKKVIDANIRPLNRFILGIIRNVCRAGIVAASFNGLHRPLMVIKTRDSHSHDP